MLQARWHLVSGSGDYVSLKEFDGGRGWNVRVHADGLRFLPVFEKITVDQVAEVARSIGGQVQDIKFYDGVAWAVQVCPLPYLEVLMILALDPEFGNDFLTYYSRSALGRVPTEDIVVYSWTFAAILAGEARRVLGGSDPRQDREEMAQAVLDERLSVFTYIDAQTAKEVAERIGGRSIDVEGARWAIEKEPLPGLPITYLLRGETGEIQYDGEALARYSRMASYFLWLCCNAIIRESRSLLGDLLPKLSDSGIL
jgi:hypothetical protein